VFRYAFTLPGETEPGWLKSTPELETLNKKQSASAISAIENCIC